MSHFQYKITDVAVAVKGSFIQLYNEDREIIELITDSRKVVDAAAGIFFALSTKRNDGHRFIEELYEKGVRNFIVSHEPENLLLLHEANIIIVRDTLLALQQLASFHRKKFNIPVIGITGSNGKTIVKEWLFELLNQDYKIVRSPKSYNSQVGVPLSVWQMTGSDTLAIFEAGISEQDEMDRLEQIVLPTIGLFTNMGHAHDENFINRVQKAGEKLKLFTHVEKLIYSPDYKDLQDGIIRSGIVKHIEFFTWSRHIEADLLIEKVHHERQNSEIFADFRGQKLSIEIPFTDEASVENAIHCWCVMLNLGYENEVIASRMKLLHPVAMRLEMKEGINNCSIINDSYSNDIDSLTIALDFLDQQKQHRKRTVILSDILQSGRNDNHLYSEVARLLEARKIERIIGIGKALSRQAPLFSMEKLMFQSTEEFMMQFPFSSFSNETILLKGARIFEFERISEALQQKTHNTILEINLGALVHNLNYYRSLLKPETKLMVMVKAFSYGSGSYEIANKLQFHKVDYLAVAYADEGVELRKAGITLPIMVMNPEEDSFDSMFKHQLEPEIYNFRSLKLLEDAVNKVPGQAQHVGIHIKIDTGMHRLGFIPDELDELISRLRTMETINICSVFSHLAGSDDPHLDDFTKQQADIFGECITKICASFDYPILSHIANSSAIKRHPGIQFDMVRLGIGLYGVSPDAEEQTLLQPVSTLKSIISQIKIISSGDTIGYSRAWKAEKETKIGIVPLGYADGLRRILGNGKGHLLLKDQLVPIIGNVNMDMVMIDITGMDAREGDEVIVFGTGRPIAGLAAEMQTIPYEILTGISQRVKRVYFEE